MATQVPHDMSAAFSALMYVIYGMKGMASHSVETAIKAYAKTRPIDCSKVAALREMVAANPDFGGARIADTSWCERHGNRYRTSGDNYRMNAATFILPNGDIFVAFRGTGNGNWSYNADSAFGGGPSKMQQLARDFFNRSMRENGGADSNIFITGHSQGGNNAKFVTLMSDPEFRRNIVNTIVFDAPGFNRSVIEEARRLLGKEYYKLVGRMFQFNGENDYVHGLGQVHIVPVENRHYIETPDLIRWIPGKPPIPFPCPRGMHCIFTRFENGRLRGSDENGNFNGVTRGPVPWLVENFVSVLVGSPIPDRQIHGTAYVLMAFVEIPLGSWRVGSSTLANLQAQGINVIISHLTQNIEGNIQNMLDALQTIGPDQISDMIEENPGHAVLLAYVFGGLAWYFPAYSNAIILAIEGFALAVEKVQIAEERTRQFILNSIRAMLQNINTMRQNIRNFQNRRGIAYAQQNPQIRVNTHRLNLYAGRIAQVNQRLDELDNQLWSLLPQVRWRDLNDILAINMLVGESETLNQVKNYLDNAAERFRIAETNVRQIF